jgi:hypothetical protein
MTTPFDLGDKVARGIGRASVERGIRESGAN